MDDFTPALLLTLKSNHGVKWVKHKPRSVTQQGSVSQITPLMRGTPPQHLRD